MELALRRRWLPDGGWTSEAVLVRVERAAFARGAMRTCHRIKILQSARRALARYADMEELIRIGAYRPGSDEETDAAIRLAEPVGDFLTQRKGEATPSSETFAELYRLLAEANIDVALPDGRGAPPPPARV